MLSFASIQVQGPSGFFFTFEDFGLLAVVFLATSVAPLFVFAAIAAFAAGVFAQAAGFSCCPTALASVDAPAPVSAGASAGPVLASHRAFAALAGISCPVLDFLYWKRSGVQCVECR